MRTALALATLAASIGAPVVAFADAPIKPPPLAHGCFTDGNPVLAITKRTTAVVTARTTLYANGAWIYDEPAQPQDKTDGPRRHARGCFDPKTREAIAKDLAAISWTVEVHRIHCHAYSANTVEFAAGGKVRYTQRLCNDTLDTASMQHLQAITATFDLATQLVDRPGPPRDD